LFGANVIGLLWEFFLTLFILFRAALGDLFEILFLTTFWGREGETRGTSLKVFLYIFFSLFGVKLGVFFGLCFRLGGCIWKPFSHFFGFGVNLGLLWESFNFDL
jgi:hypothetical protein